MVKDMYLCGVSAHLQVKAVADVGDGKDRVPLHLQITERRVDDHLPHVAQGGQASAK
jgi:hypothetical protein